MNKIHKFTSEQKLAWWGYGEWVEEPDEVNFEYEGFNCKIKRNGFLGNLCGYITLPENHPWKIIGDYEIPCKIHGGITWSQEEKDGFYWIGFNCADLGDFIPCMKMLKEKEYFREFAKAWNESYKNVDFCIQECKSLVEQAKAAQEKKQ